MSSSVYEQFIDALKDKVKEDLTIDKTNLDKESGNIPYIYHNYLQKFSRISYEVKKKQRELDEIWGKKYHYFLTEHDLELKKYEIESFIKSDPEYINIKEKLDDYILIADYLEQVLKQINQKSFNIKNMIEWNKFQHGVS